mmetsp:Transcript_86420/g.279824  ORF Transcript_86420/g.279824 Transcript_86420/m.279824 type:complete len:206 (-) Transcript_86420:60-677(-)
MHVQPTAIFRHMARCMGLRSFHICMAWIKDSISAGVSTWSSESRNHACLRHSAEVGLALSWYVRSCWQRCFASLLLVMRPQFGPLRCSSCHLTCCLAASVTLPVTSKGSLFVKSSNMTQPMLQTSLFGPQLPFQTSGAIVAGVPATLLPRMPKIPRQQTSAMPRSQTTTCGMMAKNLPLSADSVVCSSRMFWLFRSLCTTPFEWM